MKLTVHKVALGVAGIYAIYTYAFRPFKYQVGEIVALIENPSLNWQVLERKRGLMGNLYRVAYTEDSGYWLGEYEFMPSSILLA